MATFKITTSNGAFYQIHNVAAATEEAARTLAETAANDTRTLAEEAKMAAQIGEEPAGAYKVWRVEESDADVEEGCARFVDSGAEG